MDKSEFLKQAREARKEPVVLGIISGNGTHVINGQELLMHLANVTCLITDLTVSVNGLLDKKAFISIERDLAGPQRHKVTDDFPLKEGISKTDEQIKVPAGAVITVFVKGWDKEIAKTIVISGSLKTVGGN